MHGIRFNSKIRDIFFNLMFETFICLVIFKCNQIMLYYVFNFGRSKELFLLCTTAASDAAEK